MGDIVGAPVALIALLAVLRIGGGTIPWTHRHAMSHVACVVLAAVSMSFGVWNYLSHLTGHGPFHNRRTEVEGLMKVYDSIGQYIQTSCWKRNPSISFNMIGDTMSASSISVVQFERGRSLIRMEPLLGHSIMAEDRDAAFKQLEQTDVLLLGDTSKRFGLDEHYPFNNTVTPLSGDIERWARQELVSLVSTPSAEGRGYRVYVRPTMRVSGLTQDNCIPAEGFWLIGDSRVILQRPICIVPGTLEKAKEPVTEVVADLYQKDTLPVPVPADLEQDGDCFKITLDFQKVALQDEGEVSVSIRPVSQSHPKDKSISGGQQTTCLCLSGHIRMERVPDETR